MLNNSVGLSCSTSDHSIDIQQLRKTHRINTFSKLYTGIALLEEDLKREDPADKRSYDISESLNLSNMVSTFPQGFITLVNKHAIGQTAFDMIQNLLAVVEIGPQGETNICAKMIRPAQNVQMRSLIEAWSLDNTLPSTVSGELSVEEVLCGAIIIYSARALGPLAFVSSLLRATRAYISLKIAECITPRSSEEEHALFWTTMVLVESFETRLHDLPLEGVEMRGFMLKRFPWATSRQISLRVLKLFFWDEQLLKNYEHFIKPCGNVFGLEFEG